MDEEQEGEKTEEQPVKGKDWKPVFSTKTLEKTDEEQEEG